MSLLKFLAGIAAVAVVVVGAMAILNMPPQNSQSRFISEKEYVMRKLPNGVVEIVKGPARERETVRVV